MGIKIAKAIRIGYKKLLSSAAYGSGVLGPDVMWRFGLTSSVSSSSLSSGSSSSRSAPGRGGNLGISAIQHGDRIHVHVHLTFNTYLVIVFGTEEYNMLSNSFVPAKSSSYVTPVSSV